MSGAKRLFFRQENRVLRRADYLDAYARARSFRRRVAHVFVLERENATLPTRIGITATRKIGGAVVRNRAKRRLRAAAQAILPQLGKPGLDYVLIARNGAPTRAWPRLLDDVKTALISLAAESDSPSRASQRAPSSSA